MPRLVHNRKKLHVGHSSKFVVHVSRLTNECPEDAPPQMRCIYEGLRFAIIAESAMLAERSLVTETWLRKALRALADNGSLKTKQSPYDVFKYYLPRIDYIAKW